MRARNIKPDFFLDEDLATLPFETRILFAGLWCCADKAGRLEDRPIKIRAMVFPYDSVDVDAMLSQLEASGQVTRYTVEGRKYIQINGFGKHQNPHHTEKDSIIPEFNGEITVREQECNGYAPPRNHPNPPDSLITDSGFLKTDSGSPKTTRPRADAGLYRWEEFASTYHPKGMNFDKAAKSWWKRNVRNGDDVLVDSILAGVKRWNACSWYQKDIVTGSGKWLSERAFEKPTPDELDGKFRGSAQDDIFAGCENLRDR